MIICLYSSLFLFLVLPRVANPLSHVWSVGGVAKYHREFGAGILLLIVFFVYKVPKEGRGVGGVG